MRERYLFLLGIAYEISARKIFRTCFAPVPKQNATSEKYSGNVKWCSSSSDCSRGTMCNFVYNKKGQCESCEHYRSSADCNGAGLSKRGIDECIQVCTEVGCHRSIMTNLVIFRNFRARAKMSEVAIFKSKSPNNFGPKTFFCFFVYDSDPTISSVRANITKI